MEEALYLIIDETSEISPIMVRYLRSNEVKQEELLENTYLIVSHMKHEDE